MTFLILSVGKVGHALELPGATTIPQKDVVVLSIEEANKPPPPPPKPVVWQDNPYHCNEAVEWIAAEPPFICIKKAQSVTQSPRTYSTGYNGYEPGQCVWGVKVWRPDIPGNWGSAYQWIGNAKAAGWSTGSIPRVNAVGAAGNHVVLVLAVNSDGTVLIREMNYDWVPFHERTIVKPASLYTYIY